MTRWHDSSGAPVAGACDGQLASAGMVRRVTEHSVLCDQGIDRHQGISFIHGGEDVKLCTISHAPLTPMTNEADKPGVRGFFKRLRAKLNTGPVWLTTDIKELLPGRKIDVEILDDLETRLILADVGVEAAARILGDLRKRVARKELDDVDALLKALHAAMLDILRPVEQPLHIDPNIRPYVILVVGINGAGKTTTIGKLAHRLLLERRTVMLAAGDTFRAAAREQLEVWAERNKVPIIAQQAGSEPAAVIYDGLQAAKARNIDVLIADTAGRLHTQTHLMDELKKVKRVLARLDPTAPHEVLLVLDGTIGQNAIAQAEEFNRGLGVTGLVITKLDGTAKGGVVLAIAQKLKIPIRFVGVGEQSEDFGVFNASEFVSALLQSDGDAVAADVRAPG
jgi:fused signal recognition particle receptor